MSASKLNTILSDPASRAKLERRFWAKVDRRGPDECWPWIAKAVISDLKYGAINVSGIVTGSHRVAYALANGSITDGLHVRHSCDNPPCCNPAHLIEGTPADNVKDMMDRGRHTPITFTPELRERISDTRRKNRAEGKHQQSERQKQVAREVMKKRWAEPGFRERWTENMSGEKSPSYGRTFSHTDEAKRKIGLASAARVRSAETNAKISAALKGRKGIKGRKISEETRARMRLAATAREAKKREKRE